MKRYCAMTVVAALLSSAVVYLLSAEISPTMAAGTPNVAVGPQYDTTHVYVAPEDFDRFVASLLSTFGGTTSKQGVFTVTRRQLAHVRFAESVGPASSHQKQ